MRGLGAISLLRHASLQPPLASTRVQNAPPTLGGAHGVMLASLPPPHTHTHTACAVRRHALYSFDPPRLCRPRHHIRLQSGGGSHRNVCNVCCVACGTFGNHSRHNTQALYDDRPYVRHDQRYRTGAFFADLHDHPQGVWVSNNPSYQ